MRVKKSDLAKNAIGEKGNEAIRTIAGAMETCRLPIHVRFIFCNLNEASVRALANSLLANSSLIGFTCLLHPCMVEKHSDGYWYHAPTSSAAQFVRDAVIRTRAPLEIWNNWKLDDDVVAERQKFKSSLPPSSVISQPNPSPNSLDMDSELEQLTKRMEELKKMKEEKVRENEEELKQRERQLVRLSHSEKEVSTNLNNMKKSEIELKIELDQREVQLKEIRSKFENLKNNINRESQNLFQVQIQITENKAAIDRLKASLGRENLGNDSKRLKEDLEFQKAKATSLEEAAEVMKEEIDLQVICNICNERQKNLVIQCGHRTCNICLDEWRKKNDICPFCKTTIENIIRLFN